MRARTGVGRCSDTRPSDFEPTRRTEPRRRPAQTARPRRRTPLCRVRLCADAATYTARTATDATAPDAVRAGRVLAATLLRRPTRGRCLPAQTAKRRRVAATPAVGLLDIATRVAAISGLCRAAGRSRPATATADAKGSETAGARLSATRAAYGVAAGCTEVKRAGRYVPTSAKPTTDAARLPRSRSVSRRAADGSPPQTPTPATRPRKQAARDAVHSTESITKVTQSPKVRRNSSALGYVSVGLLPICPNRFEFGKR